jgi:Protein of unknown function (DUF1579)
MRRKLVFLYSFTAKGEVMKRTFVSTALIVTALASAPLARAADSMTALKPAPEMAKLKTFEGRWTCTGQMDAGAFGPARKTTTRVTAHSDLGGFWVSGRVVVEKTRDNPVPMEGMFHQTWDRANKRYLMLWVDSGGGWSQETSPGWEGDTITWTGDGWFGGQKAGERDGFTVKPDGSLVHTMAVEMNGQWTPLGEETCHKSMAHQ